MDLRRPLSLLALAPFALLVAGCGDETAIGAEQDATATSYLDATAFLTTQADKDAWSNMITVLEGEFNNVCGDTFCGGDYSNLTSLGLTCAVSSKVGQIHDCLWTFAGSSEIVTATTGALLISKPSFQCHFKTTARATSLPATLTASITGENDALQRALPGGTTSIYDALGDCFQHPIGTTPTPNPFTKTPSYVTAGDAPQINGDWWTAGTALEAGFAADCPGTFCKGTYKDLSAIRLVCAVSVTTGNAKSCAFVVAGNNAKVSATKGTVTDDFASYRCSLPMKGSPNDLSAVILGAGPTPMLDRALPGGTKTFRQALDSCL
ncbi:MAG: hypothetical protein ABJE95_12020 [Byssovorax sp.]